MSSEIRLNKFIAQNTNISRRKADEAIISGEIKINGKIVNELGTKVTEFDVVKYGNKIIKENKRKYYFVLNKPREYVSSNVGQFEQKTVFDLIDKNRYKDVKLFCVGRLDYQTTGLMILTNDGDFTNAITNSRAHIQKKYVIKLNKIITDEDIIKLENGVYIDDRIKTKRCIIKKYKIEQGKSFLKITLFEGKNRQIRKMFESLRYDVVKLKRTQIGNLRLDNVMLNPGQYREMPENIIKPLIGIRRKLQNK